MATLTISLPLITAKRIDDEAKSGGFATRSEFIRALIRKYFSGELSLEIFSAPSLDNIKKDLTKTGKYDSKFINSVIDGLAKSSIYAN